MTTRFAYTDYPFGELGDAPGELAPVRHCVVLAYDGNKYCLVKVGGRVAEVKSGYLYLTPSRCGSARQFPARWLRWLPRYVSPDDWLAARDLVRKLRRPNI